jgi:hypothetical protein
LIYNFLLINRILIIWDLKNRKSLRYRIYSQYNARDAYGRKDKKTRRAIHLSLNNAASSDLDRLYSVF